MNITGLITEYNPFHNGHQYHIEQAKRLTGADAVIVVMSGNFVQRGAPAIMPKHLRTHAALSAGASVVIELPVYFALGSAELFAYGAVSLLHELGCVDSICFGSECGDIAPLEQVADIFIKEPEEYQMFLKQYLKSGCSFPLARQHALSDYTKNPTLNAVLEKPNNILGIEYLKALKRLSSTIKPYTITRMESNYHDTTLQTTYSSASAIRTQFHAYEDLTQIDAQIPASTLELWKTNLHTRFPIHSDDFSLLMKYRLLSETRASLTSYLDVTDDLANRILKYRNQFIDISQFCQLLKTKDITYTRISRVLFHMLLNIQKSHPASHGYAHILGFQKKDAAVLTLLKAKSRLPLLTKLTATDSLSTDGIQQLACDIYASDLYESVVSHKYKTSFISEYEQPVIRL